MFSLENKLSATGDTLVVSSDACELVVQPFTKVFIAKSIFGTCLL